MPAKKKMTAEFDSGGTPPNIFPPRREISLGQHRFPFSPANCCSHAASEVAPTEAPALAGNLDQMPLPDLLQTAGSNGRTGRIDLAGGDDEAQQHTGRIWLRDGRVVDAAIRSEDAKLTGRDALYQSPLVSTARFFDEFPWNGETSRAEKSHDDSTADSA